MWKCEKCGNENQDRYRFCIGCGTERPRSVKPRGDGGVSAVWKCRYCGKENPDTTDFCAGCGISRPQVSRPADPKAAAKKKHIILLAAVAVLFVLGACFLNIWQPLPAPPQSSPAPEPAVTESPEPEAAPSPVPAPAPEPEKTAPPESGTLPDEASPGEAPQEEAQASSPAAAAVGASSDQELVFSYSGGEKSLLLTFDPKTREILQLRSLYRGSYEFSYEFTYLPDGRLAKIARLDAGENPVVTREVAYTDDVLSVERRIVTGRKDIYTDLAAKKNYSDSLTVSGHTVEKAFFPRTGEGANVYTLSVWSESRETGAAKAADREVFRICFGADGRAVTYTYCWRNELAAFPEYEQFAEETHARDENGAWYHFATLLTLKDKNGRQTGVYQRLLDDPEWTKP